MIDEYIDSEEYSELCKSIMNRIYSKVLEKQKISLQYELTETKKQIKNLYRNQFGSHIEQINSQKLDALLGKQKLLIKKIGEIGLEHPTFTNQMIVFSKICVDVKKIIREIMLDDNVINKLIKKIEIGHLEKTCNENRQKITLYYNF